jgi:hypothetical protein
LRCFKGVDWLRYGWGGVGGLLHAVGAEATSDGSSGVAGRV